MELMMDDVRLKELRALCDAATPGPWRRGAVEHHHVFCPHPGALAPELGRVLLRMNEYFPHADDATFIAAASTALPEALDEIERLREALRIAMRRWFDESPSDVYDPDTYEEVDVMLDGPHEWSGDDWKRCKAALLGLPPAGSR
jgi:hypothetical protein